MSEQFPRQFGKYVLLKSLARGGMGEIYLAASGQRGGLSKLCVIKKVITGKGDPAKVNRFLDEAKVVLRLSHANLVSTFDAGDVQGELFIAMELVEGKDLREIWNRCVRTRTRIPVEVALVVVRETARALGYVHTYGGLRLVHRDVAPPNILLSYFGEVKLTDFGLARSILKQEHTAPGVVFGRASYLAPEQARGEVADARTDVYSLGIILWELLTGQPYLQLAGLDPVTSLSLVRNPRPQPPSERAPWIGPELDAVVLKALAPDRATRFQSAEELRRELADVMTKVAPRADSERVTEFLRGLYREVIPEESAERERLLAETVPLFRGERLPDLGTPRTDVFPPVTVDGEGPPLNGPVGPAASHEGATVLAPVLEGAAVSRLADAPKESLHVSALRARADSQVRRPEADTASVDAPTKVWRKERGARGQDAAQTFVGRVIDNRYRIHHRIGEGGMGTVYAAEHVEIGKNVAVKILHRIFSGEEQLVERFRREARAASRVGHPHIIDVTDFGTTEEGCAYFVMELLEGTDLADLLVREGRLDPARTVRISVQICQALEAAHVTGIIHRDLKPENIFLVARDGQADFVKVLDFGIARNLSGESRRLTNPGMAMGTPEYMAPEQSQGKPADRRTDVYAVGALLHEMLIGVAPFQAETQAEMLDAKRRPLASLRGQRPDIPASLDAVVLRALAPEPERRPQTMAHLEYELAKIAWGRPQAVAELLGLKDRSVEPEDGRPIEGDADAPAAPDASADADDETGPLQFGDGNRGDDAGADQDSSASRATRGREVDQSTDLAGDTPPPPSVWVAAAAAPEAPDFAREAPDFEKLLESDLSPAPEARPVAAVRPVSGLRPVPELNHGFARPSLPTPSRSRNRVAPLIDVPPRLSPVGSGPHGAGGRDGPDRAFLAAEVDTAALTLSPPRGSRRSRTALTFAVLALVGGATAWAATNGGPGFARDWLRRARGQGADLSAGPAKGEGAPLVARTAAAAPAAAGAQTSAAIAARPLPLRQGLPEIVQVPALERARTALAAGVPDDAVAVLRPVVARGDGAARPLLAQALVASGWKDVKVYHWASAGRKAREAIAVSAPDGPSHGGQALLGEALYAMRDYNAALVAFTKALTESPGDPRLKRRVIRSRRQLHRPVTDAKGATAKGAPATATTDGKESLSSEATSE